MTRSFSSFLFALATTTVILLATGKAPAADPTSPAAPAAAPQANPYPEVQVAVQRLIDHHDMPGALKGLEEAARKYPELPSAHVMMYQIFVQIREPNAARLQLEEAIKANPNDPEPYILRGNTALQDRRAAEAATDFEKAKQLLTTYNSAVRKRVLEQQTLSGLSHVAEVGGDWKEAEAQLQALLYLTPRDLIAHQRLARSLFWQGKTAEAFEILKKGKQIDRENSAKNKTREVFLTRGRVGLAKGQDRLGQGAGRCYFADRGLPVLRSQRQQCG
jgi:tetratricopeptide (TPR) repeat protein